jgi:CheY-like chemotaxis protein
MVGDKARCLEAGMDGYISKPIQIELVIQEIQRVLAAPPPRRNPETPHGRERE